MKTIVIDSSYFFVNTRYKWRQAGGKETYVDELGDNHLKNIYKLLADRSRYFPSTYLGYSRNAWKQVMFLELRKRQGLDSRKSYKSNTEKVLEDMDRKIKREKLRSRIITSYDNISW